MFATQCDLQPHTKYECQMDEENQSEKQKNERTMYDSDSEKDD